MPYRLSTDYKIHELGMTWNGHFCVKFSLLRTAFQQLSYIFIVESLYTRDQRRCAEADRDPQNIWNPQKLRSFVVAASSEP